MNFDYEFIVNPDLTALARLETICFDEQNRWTQNMLNGSISSKTARFFGVFAQKELIAYCLIDEMGLEAELLRICVSPLFRRLGIGKKLLDYVVAELKSNFLGDGERTLTLEVSVNNLPAKKLYENSGFNQIAIRKDYYVESGKRCDAIIMRLFL